jgi:tripartite-type tricarboxylate transporter receptor subunit TctC
MSSSFFRAVVLCVAASIAAPALAANAYPSKPVRLIVPFPPGGGVDVMGRLLADALTKELGQQVVVDNRGGAGTIIGTDLLARSQPDGYTMLMANVAFSANPALHRKLPYDSAKDFAPVSEVVLVPSILTVNPKLPVKSVRELVALAKSEPGKLSYGSAGTGSYIHISMELFKSAAGIDIVHVPYKGAAPALNDLLGDQIPIMFLVAQVGLPHIKSGRLRGLGVSSEKRMPLLPDVPTIAESGYPGFSVYDWQGVLVPAHTPQTIVATLNRAINQALTSKEVAGKMTSMGATPAGSTPEAFGRRIRSEFGMWKKVVKEAKIPVAD